MRVEYTFSFPAVCPVDKKPDIYLCVVRSAQPIPVERILEAATEATKGEPVFQEEITQRLHRLLAAEVETSGRHSGVHTRCVAGGGVG